MTPLGSRNALVLDNPVALREPGLIAGIPLGCGRNNVRRSVSPLYEEGAGGGSERCRCDRKNPPQSPLGKRGRKTRGCRDVISWAFGQLRRVGTAHQFIEKAVGSAHPTSVRRCSIVRSRVAGSKRTARQFAWPGSEQARAVEDSGPGTRRFVWSSAFTRSFKGTVSQPKTRTA